MTRKLFVLWCFAGPVLADSAVGVATLPGNTLNPSGVQTEEKDPRGLSLIKPIRSRSSTGLLYDTPSPPPETKPLSEDWVFSGRVEAGVLLDDGDEDSAQFIEYSDWDAGFLLNGFEARLIQPETGYYVDLLGSAVGRNDQFYELLGGRHGSFKFRGFYNEIPHVFSTNASTFYQGVGSDTLTLPEGLAPGNNSQEEIRNALQQSAYPTSLSLKRKKGGIDLALTPSDQVELFARYSQEARDGTRPFGGGFFPSFYTSGDQGGTVETIEPIDYITHDVLAGLRYGDAEQQFNLSYKGSFFRNDTQTLTWENPFSNGLNGAEIIPRGRFALYPDNDSHNINAEYAHALPLRGQFTATASWTRMRQDEDLIPPTVNSVQSRNNDLNNWNSTAALSRQSADAEIETTLLQAGLKLSPRKDLTLRAKLRYYDEDNKTDYTAFNPLTGQYGYIIEDGAYPGGVFEPGVPGSFWHIRSIPFSYSKTNLNLGADYRFNPKTKLGVDYDREDYERDHRERDETTEDRFTLSLSSRTFSQATLRFSYEYADRDGSTYDPFPYDPFYSSSLPGYVPALPEGTPAQVLDDLRKFDVSDRRQQVLNARVNVLIDDDMDLNLSGKWTDNDYGTRYGRTEDDDLSLNMEWNYHPSPDFSAYALYSFQRKRMDMAAINETGFSVDGSAGGDTFGLEGAWSQASDETNHMIGLGFDYRISERFSLGSHYSYNWYRGEIDYDFASEAAFPFSPTPITAEAAGNAFPDLRYRLHTLETSFRWKLNKGTSVRLFHRFEKGDIRDWHFQDLEPLQGQALFLAATPQDYETNIFGVLLEVLTY